MLANLDTATIEVLSTDDCEEAMQFDFIPKELLEKEEYYRKLDRDLQAKTTQTLAETQHVVSASLGLLDNPNFFAPVSAESLVDLEPFDTAINASVSSSTSQQNTNAPVQRKPQSAPITRKKPGSAEAVPVSMNKKKPGLSPLEISLIEKVTEKLQSLDDDPVHDYTLEATNRYLKARLLVIEEEMGKLANEASQVKQFKVKEQALIKQNETMHQKMTKQNQHLLTSNEKQALQIQELTQKLQQAEQRIHSLQQELHQSKKLEKVANSDSSQKDTKLVRAQDEVQRLRQHQTQLEAEHKKSIDQLKLSIDRLTSEIKRLEKQKAQLIIGFKKQGALIDVLRKQKLHLEAIKLLSFTEEEFSKLLDWY